MLIFTLSSPAWLHLSWFMDLTFQVSMQYCSLQHWTLLSPPDTYIAEHFCFGSASSFWSYFYALPPKHIGHLLTWEAHVPVSYFFFCLLILFMGFSRQEYGSVLPFSSPGDHILSELCTMICPSCMALHGMAHGFFKLHKAMIHVILLFGENYSVCK